MREYLPDRWVIVAIASGKETIFKVFAGWVGGYLYGDSWRMNSGIAEVGLDGDDYLFKGYSGSVYRCNKNSYGFSGYTAQIWRRMVEDRSAESPDVLPADTDFMALPLEKGP